MARIYGIVFQMPPLTGALFIFLLYTLRKKLPHILITRDKLEYVILY